MLSVIAAFAAGWFARGRRPPYTGVITLARRSGVVIADEDTEQRSEQKNRQYFVAGIALGIVGNALITLLVDFLTPGIVGFLLVAAILIVGLAYADTVLRAAGPLEALLEVIVLALVGASLFLSVVIALRLGGISCESCPPVRELVIASVSYGLLALAAAVVTRVVVPRAGRGRSLPS